MGLYGADELLNCNRLGNNYDGDLPPYTEEEIQDILTIFPLDMAIILILGLVSMCCSTFIIYTFYKFPETRKQPGDIILAMSIAELVLACHWYSMVIIDLVQGRGPDNHICQVECVFSIMAGTAEFIYNCLFCLYIILAIKDCIKKTSNTPKKRFHLVAFVVIVSVYGYCLGTDNTGLSLFGMCSFKQTSSFGYFGVILVCLYLILSVFTILYFRRKVPKNDQFKQMRKEFLGFFYRYVISQSIIWGVLAGANLLVGLNCKIFQKPGLNFFVTVGNTSKLCTPIFLSLIRYRDPIIRKKVEPILKKKFSWCRCCLRKRTRSNASSLQGSEFSGVEHNENYYQILSNNLRVSQIYTMISGMIASQKLSYQRQSLSLRDMNMEDCISNFTLEINNDKIKPFECLKLAKNQKIELAHKAKMTFYAPRVFKTMIEIDRKLVNLESAFNIGQNFEDIKSQFGGGDGGASGSFFYLTHDKKMLMKSITDKELQVFKGMLYDYTQYLGKNENSFISRIYGLFSFSFGTQTEHIIIQRNIQQIPSKYRLRAYDLKGSTVSREVLKKVKEEEREEAAGSKTLKDLDFTNLEKPPKINIDKNVALQISQQLTNDANFFRNQELLDYSLLVFKMNWTGYGIENNLEERMVIKSTFNNQFQCIESQLEPGIYYHMSVIDYFQTWDNNKKIEKGFKVIKNVDQKLDVSAQPPPEYAERFIANVAQKLFLY